MLLAPGRRGRRDAWPARASSSGSSRGCRRSAASCSRCRASGRGTTRSSCRCTARTRRRTPPSRWPRSRRSPATQPLDEDLVRAAFAEVTSPGRLEIIRRSPTIVLDAAHNPHGAEAIAAALEDSFALRPADRRPRRDGRQGPRGPAGGVRAAPRARRAAPRTPPTARCRAEELAEVARRDLRRGPGAPSRRGSPTRSTRPRRWPRPARRSATRSAPAAVLVTGSVVTVGEARAMLGQEPVTGRPTEPATASTASGRGPRAAACARRSCPSRRSRSA